MIRMPRIQRSIVLAVALVLVIPGQVAHAQQRDTAVAADTSRGPAGAPVVFEGDTLFILYGSLGPFSAQDRAAGVARRLRADARTPDRRRDSVAVAQREGVVEVLLGDEVLMNVLPADAAAAATTPPLLAEFYAGKIRSALQSASARWSLKAVLLGALFTLLATAALLLLLRLLRWFFPRVYGKIESWRATRIPSIRLQRLELLSASRITDFLLGATRVLRIALTVLLFYFYIPLVLSFFPWTQRYAGRIVGYVTGPLEQVGQGLLGYLPNLFFIAVIVLVTRYVIALVHFFFRAIESGTINFRGFHRDWAEPTFKIVRFLVIAFAIVVLFPYLPGAQSPAFRGISIFLGVLFSLGSSSAVSNVVSGVVLTYTRAFQVGDRVQIGETTGDVLERTLLVTRLRTIKNVEVTIPNGMVLGSHILNYTSEAANRGLILHTSVTIGYNADWRQVHQLLIDAALATDQVQADPPPFVLQTALNDFFVTYELNATTRAPRKMAQVYSDLHRNIQDRFNAAGVEIMSPHYRAMRDGNAPAMPEQGTGKKAQGTGGEQPA